MKVEPSPARAREDFLRRGHHTGALLTLALTAAVAGADEPRTRVVAAGAQYEAGGMHTLLLGHGYRDLWGTPIEVPVLDPDTYEGGLTAIAAGTLPENPSLQLEDASGRPYLFRSLDKDAG